MKKIIRNEWRPTAAGESDVAHILHHDVHPEGLSLFRVRYRRAGRLALNPEVGHIISPLSGEARLVCVGEELRLAASSHLYLPRGVDCEVSQDFAAVVLSGGDARQSAGEKPLLRSEEFLRCCAGEGPFRWILTPQYLSRRVFLHHDATLHSKAGRPISWFRTTMFDVTGLPENDAGEPVFKMSYNYRTEPNVLVDVEGALRVRMARHPYVDAGQQWDDWHTLGSEHTYHLNEPAGGVEEEWHEESGKKLALRNKHEVSLRGGFATLFCVFDPAPTGTEKHRAGAYSDYGPLSDVLGTPEYAAHLQKMAPLDEMVDSLSFLEAGGTLQNRSAREVAEYRALAEQGRSAQRRYESELVDALVRAGSARAEIVQRWLSDAPAL